MVLIMIAQVSLSQNIEDNTPRSNIILVSDAGLLLGHADTHYPAPFSVNFTTLYQINNWLYAGVGAGVQQIGKTFVPIFTDIRIAPFKSKPLFLYNRLGASFCIDKSYSESNNNGYYPNYPHPLIDQLSTHGGFYSETGIGVKLHHEAWSNSYSIGFNHQNTSDVFNNGYERTYNYVFNRLAFRVGFWF